MATQNKPLTEDQVLQLMEQASSRSPTMPRNMLMSQVRVLCAQYLILLNSLEGKPCVIK